MAQTEYNDRSGKPIYTGDIVQYRLSTNAKRSGGPWMLQVRKTKRGIKLVYAGNDAQGLPLRKNIEQYVSIIDTSQRETS